MVCEILKPCLNFLNIIINANQIRKISKNQSENANFRLKDAEI